MAEAGLSAVAADPPVHFPEAAGHTAAEAPAELQAHQAVSAGLQADLRAVTTGQDLITAEDVSEPA